MVAFGQMVYFSFFLTWCFLAFVGIWLWMVIDGQNKIIKELLEVQKKDFGKKKDFRKTLRSRVGPTGF
ncbi:hypothetical protein ACFL35_02605 [Candidatus Riflebacteria bacterium]